jgi:DNA polymerase III epsilon subunit-like protein
MSEPLFVGLDGEMTGTRSPEEFQLIQIGVATLDHDIFVRDIGYYHWNSTPEAMAVNKFTPERIRAGTSPYLVDLAVEEFLFDQSAKAGSCVAIGWNVAFDISFVRRYLPFTAKMFSYRAVDLNSVCFTLGKATGRDWKDFKRGAKTYSAKQPIPGQPHDAGYDACAAVYEWEYLQKEINYS